MRFNFSISYMYTCNIYKNQLTVRYYQFFNFNLAEIKKE